MVLFITRKYPPARGGMEEFSFQLYQNFPGEKSLVALERGQRWLPLLLFRALWTAQRQGRRHNAVHLGDGMLAPLGPMVERLSRQPTFVTVHGQEVARGWPGYRHAVRFGLRNLSGRIIAVSSYTAAVTEELSGQRPTVIHNGVDASRFAAIERAADPAGERAALGLPTDGPLIVSVGRLVKRKGICWFASQVLPLLPPDVTFAVIGGGPEETALRSLATADSRIQYLGAAVDEVVDRLYSCADLFVAPNIAVAGKPEGFGIAPAEAAAAGLPVAVSALEGLTDMATVAGATLVPAGDPRAWAQVVARLVRVPRAERQPPRTWRRVADDYARFFDDWKSRPSAR